MGIIQFLLLLLLLLLGGTTTSSSETERSTPINRVYEIGDILHYSHQYFTPDLWQQVDLGTSDNDPAIGFNSITYGAAVAISSTSNTNQIDYNWLDILMTNYHPWQLTAQCQQGDIQLFEMQGKFGGNDYLTRYWVAPLRTDRLRTVHLVFPIYRETELNHYAQLMFPELPSCEA